MVIGIIGESRTGKFSLADVIALHSVLAESFPRPSRLCWEERTAVSIQRSAIFIRCPANTIRTRFAKRSNAASILCNSSKGF